MEKIITADDIAKHDRDILVRIQNTCEPTEIRALLDAHLSPGGFIQVLGKFMVTPMLYEYTAHQLSSISLHLIPGVEYTARDLVGETCWAEGDGSSGWRREIELSLHHFAANPDSPITDLKNGKFGVKETLAP